MKKALFLLFFLVMPLAAMADESGVIISHFEYNLYDDGTAKLTKYKYWGSNVLTIPETVNYQNRTYTVTTIGYQAFADCSTLRKITIPNSVTTIESWAFTGCSLQTITIPESVTEIQDYTFDNCISLSTVTLPEGLTKIGKHAFSRSGLTQINFPSTLTTIGSYAFENCSSMVRIQSYIVEPFNLGTNAFSGMGRAEQYYYCYIYVPYGTKNAYIAKGWDTSSTVISERNKSGQTLSLNTLPTMVYGDGDYSLPSETAQGLPLTWSVKDESVAIIPSSNDRLCIMGVGTTTVTAKQAGNNEYEPFLRNFTLTVTGKNASNLTINPIAAVTYNGSAQTPTVTVMDGSTTLTSGTDYTVAYSNNTNAGTATVTITGMGNYTGTKNANFTINPKNASNLTISDIAAVTYNGSAQTPTVTVKDGTTTLTNGTHYTVSYSNNTNAGTATVTITGMGNYTGTKNANFTINPKRAYNLTISDIAAVTYNGSAQTPTVTVKDGTTTLTNGTHYTVSYSNNTNAGTATVTITGKGNYTSTTSTYFTINPKNASNLTINSIAAQTYSGSAKTPTVTVKDGTTTLVSGTDYTVSYSSNINAGTATVTITGKGNYTSTKSANFTINKAPLTITAKSYIINQKDDLPEFEVTYDGFKNAETSSVLTTLPTITCDATDSETVGVFDITPSGAAATNYSFNYVKGTLTVNTVESVTIAMKAGGGDARNMIAYSSKYALDFTDIPEIKAYIACGYNWKKEVILVHVKVVPPYTGMVIKTSNSIYDGGEYEVPTTTEDYYFANLLVPVVETRTVTPTETIDEEEFTNFAIGTLYGGGIGFVRLTSNWTAQNKSYLRVPTSLYNSSASARQLGGFGIVFEDDEATGISNLNDNVNDNVDANAPRYNIAGQRVGASYKGVVIQNGKKILIK